MAGRGVDGVAHGRSQRRQRRLADASGREIRLDEMHVNYRRMRRATPRAPELWLLHRSDMVACAAPQSSGEA